MKRSYILLAVLFITTLRADLKYDQNTGRYFTTANSPLINQYEYHTLVVDILNMLSSSETIHKEIDQSIMDRFGCKTSIMPARDTNALKCIIIDSLMRLGTPTARQLLADLAKVNYLLK